MVKVRCNPQKSNTDTNTDGGVLTKTAKVSYTLE